MSGAAVRAPGGGPRQDAPRDPGVAGGRGRRRAGAGRAVDRGLRGVKGVAGVPDAVRGVLAALLLFGVTGYAPARLLIPRALFPHLPFFVLGFGAAVSCLGLSVLGFFGVPIVASLAVLLGGGLVAGLLLRVRRGPARAEEAALAGAGGRTLAWAWPAYIALMLVALCLIPTFRAGYGSVPGTNPDGMLSVGTAEFLQHNPADRGRPRAARRPDAARLAVQVPDLLRPGRRGHAQRPGPRGRLHRVRGGGGCACRAGLHAAGPLRAAGARRWSRWWPWRWSRSRGWPRTWRSTPTSTSCGARWRWASCCCSGCGSWTTPTAATRSPRSCSSPSACRPTR